MDGPRVGATPEEYEKLALRADCTRDICRWGEILSAQLSVEIQVGCISLAFAIKSISRQANER